MYQGGRMYPDKPIRFFLDKLCSNSPEPGGGSASALTGAVAASLSGRSSELKEELLDLLQKDTEAFDDASKAFKMPKDTEEQKNKRAEAIEAGLKKATEVPLGIMEKSLEVARLAKRVLTKGNKMAITDGAISALFADAAAIGAMINVRINFSWMKDQEYIARIEKRLAAILEETKKIKEEAISYTLKELQK